MFLTMWCSATLSKKDSITGAFYSVLKDYLQAADSALTLHKECSFLLTFPSQSRKMVRHILKILLQMRQDF